ncbi:MAG: F0F1 ATP synthase subunit epsilon [Bacteroidota bacterium]
MAKTLSVDIVSPKGSLFQGDVQSIQAPGLQGTFQVLYNHAPMIAALAVGPMTIVTGSGERVVFATSGGFLEVIKNKVTVLAETAEPASDIDVERAQAAEQRALDRLKASGSGAERERASAALERARNRARIAMGQVGTRS